jgi:hypothetical protein
MGRGRVTTEFDFMNTELLNCQRQQDRVGGIHGASTYVGVRSTHLLNLAWARLTVDRPPPHWHEMVSPESLGLKRHFK